MNKTLLIAVGVLLLMGIIAFILPFLFDDVVVSRIGLLGKVVATCAMLAYGTFMNRRYFFLAYVIAAGIGIGVAFKIMHYEGATRY